MTVHWHRVESHSSPKGHELRTRARGKQWRAWQAADGSWRVKPTGGPQKPVTKRSWSDVRSYVEHGVTHNPPPQEMQVELVDDERDEVEWSGTLEEFIEANEDDLPFESDEVTAHMWRHGSLTLGGGAAPLMTLRTANPKRKQRTDMARRNPKRKNVAKGKTGEVGETEARELELYIDNDEPLYRKWQAIVKNLWRHRAKGRFDKERAIDGFMYLVDEGAKKYAKEFSVGTDWNMMFNSATRRHVARQYAESFENNERDEIEYAPANAKQNPRKYGGAADDPEIRIKQAYITRKKGRDTANIEYFKTDGTLAVLLGPPSAPEIKAALKRAAREGISVQDLRDNPRKANPVTAIAKRKANPARGRKKNGAGLGAFIGSMVGSVLGFGVASYPLAVIGSVAGAAVGGHVGAPRDRKRRGAAGGAIGGALLGPIGAAAGGYIGGKRPDKDFERSRRNPSREDNPRRKNARKAGGREYIVWQHHSNKKWFVNDGVSPAATSARGYDTAKQAEKSAEDLIYKRGVKATLTTELPASQQNPKALPAPKALSAAKAAKNPCGCGCKGKPGGCRDTKPNARRARR